MSTIKIKSKSVTHSNVTIEKPELTIEFRKGILGYEWVCIKNDDVIFRNFDLLNVLTSIRDNYLITESQHQELKSKMI